jgi:malate dehydrogenase (oxaloacetate-decarboxylating)
MPAPSTSYSATIRVVLAGITEIGELTRIVHQAGGVVVAMDVVDGSPSQPVVDITCNAINETHVDQLVAAIESVPRFRVRAESDRTFLLHLGGKLEVQSKSPLRTREELSMAYTPGVARVCRAIAADPRSARNLTVKRNSVAVVTDGSAVLGLGNIGPEAALPVMEGKAMLFKRFADINAWPVCIGTQDTAELVRTIELIAPVYGGINLEDIAAPRCFDVEEQLRAKLDIPVFHDDQHGTAIVVLAALTNALKVVGKSLPEARVVVSGVGAAGVATIKLLVQEGVREILAVDRSGILPGAHKQLFGTKAWVAENTNPFRLRGGLPEAMVGADVFIGVSAPNLLGIDELATMAPNAIVFALANPDPEVDPGLARTIAAVVATGRSDEPNQINNVLAFPGVFRGALDANASTITGTMEKAGARALAAVVSDEELSPAYIVPSVFNPIVVPTVASAVAEAAVRERVTRPDERTDVDVVSAGH